MLTNLELREAKKICNLKEPSQRLMYYFTYTLYPLWIEGRKIDKYEYDEEKVSEHFKHAKRIFLKAQDELTNTKEERLRVEPSSTRQKI